MAPAPTVTISKTGVRIGKPSTPVSLDSEGLPLTTRHTSVAQAFDRTVPELSDDAIRVADNNIVRAIQLVSTERGRDPRDYVLVPFGGAGPLHAARVDESAPQRARDLFNTMKSEMIVAFSALSITDAIEFSYVLTTVTRIPGENSFDRS